MSTLHHFDGRAQDYAAGRPGYPDALMDALYARLAPPQDCVFADIGAGTGKFSSLLLARGSTVYAVEPNADMRLEAQRALGSQARFHCVPGSAENTLLPDAIAHCITAVQAFHWFDAQAFRRECQRIARPGAPTALIWNKRIADAVNTQLHALNTRFCPHFQGFSAGSLQDDAPIAAFFGAGYDCQTFDYPLYFDRQRFIARCLSSSYFAAPGRCAIRCVSCRAACAV